ncbi:hypothetical protein ACQJBY_036486 [Aegilops geniculata]
MFVWVLGSGGCAAESVRVPLDGGGDDANLLRLQTSLPPLLRFVPLPLARSAVATPPEDVLALFLSHIAIACSRLYNHHTKHRRSLHLLQPPHPQVSPLHQSSSTPEIKDPWQHRR